MEGLVQQLALLTTTTWIIVEALKRLFKVDPRLLALCISLVLALVAVYTGYLPKEFKSFLLAVGAAMGSSVFADKVVGGISDSVKK